MVIEEKIPLQTMSPLSSFGISAGTSQPSSIQLALVLAQPGLEVPGSSATVSAELDEEIQRIMAPLFQQIGEADDPADAVMDLSFLASVATGIKEM